MVADYANCIGHFHELPERPYRMRPSVQDITQHIEGILILKRDLLKHLHEHVILTVNVGNNVSCHLSAPYTSR